MALRQDPISGGDDEEEEEEEADPSASEKKGLHGKALRVGEVNGD